jgi:hypothetical protein
VFFISIKDDLRLARLPHSRKPLFVPMNIEDEAKTV